MLLADRETTHVFERRFGLVHAADFCPAWTFPQQPGQLGKLIGGSHGVNFHAAIVPIAHPAREAQRVRGMLGKIAEPDALHASAHAIKPR